MTEPTSVSPASHLGEARKSAEPLPERAEIHDIAWSQAPYIALSGMCMGTADVVPGVSGGTMAVALGIYRRLLAAINSVNAELLRAALKLNVAGVLAVLHWRFLSMLLAGVVLAVVVMLKIVGLPRLLETHTTYVYAVFFGLVLASAVVLVRRLPRWSPAALAAIVGGVGFGLLIVNLVPVSTPDHPLFIFFAGMIAICAMLLPGISGSFILLILGKYAYVLDALSALNLAVVLPFAAGCGAGILAFSRVLAWLLDRWHDPMVAGLTGLLIGSLWRIWPYQQLVTEEIRGKVRVLGADPFWPGALEPSVVLLAVAGLVTVLGLERLAVERSQGR